MKNQKLSERNESGGSQRYKLKGYLKYPGEKIREWNRMIAIKKKKEEEKAMRDIAKITKT